MSDAQIQQRGGAEGQPEGTLVNGRLETVFPYDWPPFVGFLLGVPAGLLLAFNICDRFGLSIGCFIGIIFGSVFALMYLLQRFLVHRRCIFDPTESQLLWRDVWLGCIRRRERRIDFKLINYLCVVSCGPDNSCAVAVQIFNTPYLIGIRVGMSNAAATELVKQINHIIGRTGVVVIGDQARLR